MFNNLKTMGVEVKSGGEGVIVADRGCNDDRRHYVSQIRKECILHRCTPFFVYTHLKIKRYGK